MTKIATLATAALLTTAAMVQAEGCNWMKEQTAMSCAEGTTLDPETNTCVPVVNS